MDEPDGDVTYLPPTVEVRKWADHPAESGYVPVHPTTLRAIADEIDQLRRLAADRDLNIQNANTERDHAINSASKLAKACQDLSHERDACLKRLEENDDEIERLRAALGNTYAVPGLPEKAQDILLAAIEGRAADETTPVHASASQSGTTTVTVCGPDDHLYAAKAGSPIGDGICIKCGAKEPQ